MTAGSAYVHTVHTAYLPVHRLGGVRGEMSSAVRFSHLLQGRRRRVQSRQKREEFHERGKGEREDRHIQPFNMCTYFSTQNTS